MSVISRLFDNYSDAARAVSELERAGLPADDISIVANNSEGWYRDDGAGVRGPDVRREPDDPPDQDVPKQAGLAGLSDVAAQVVQQRRRP